MTFVRVKQTFYPILRVERHIFEPCMTDQVLRCIIGKKKVLEAALAVATSLFKVWTAYCSKHVNSTEFAEFTDVQPRVGSARLFTQSCTVRYSLPSQHQTLIDRPLSVVCQ